MLKIMIVGRRRGGLTLAQHHDYMMNTHGAAVVRFIAEAPDLAPRRYVQNHVFDGSFRAPGDTPDPFAAARDFITQVWFDDPAQAGAAMQARFYREHLQPDEDRFVDQLSVSKLPVAEVSVSGAAAPAGRSKVFVFHRAAAGVSVDALLAGTQAAWAEAGNGTERLVRNRVLSRPGEPAPGVDLVDEAWLADDTAARALAAHWQALADGGALAALLPPGSGFVLLAREHRLFAGA